jgi:hypothetical protein
MRPILLIAPAIVVFAATMNGMLLFGLTTAFLFTMISEVWDIGSRTQTLGAEWDHKTRIFELFGKVHSNFNLFLHARSSKCLVAAAE